MKKEIAQIDYDKLLKLFVGDDMLKASFMQPNSVGDKTYSTDARAMIIIPNTHLKKEYPPHPQTPNYQHVIDQAKPIDHLIFKDVDLFNALKEVPLEYDKMICEKCEGRGECECCGVECNDCSGTGEVADQYAPMVYSRERSAIKIGDHHFSPYQLGKLEKVLIETESDIFTIVATNSTVAMIEVQDIVVMLSKLVIENLDEEPNIFELKQKINNLK